MAQTLGRYHIISELGRGGMGVVYKALDPKLERFIAIKCLSEELSADEIVVARFLREARNVAALNHPNIAQIFVADEHDGKPYFVMEYVDGESLADFIDREGQCSPEMARRVTEQAANALAAAAAENLVHRDVKPGNIMLDSRRRAVLTDFGIAGVATGGGEGRESSIMGTPGYLPPEALGGAPPDARADMFALGAVYYEMLTGERLIVSHDFKDMFRQFAEPGFPDLSSLEGKIDPRVIDILRRLLAIRPDDRFGSWAQVLEAMAPLKTGETGPVKRPDSGPSTAETAIAATLATQPTGATADTPTEIATGAAKPAGASSPGREAGAPVPATEQAPRRGKRLALAGGLVVALALAGLGVARMDAGHWQQLRSFWPGGEETVVSDADANDTALAVSAGPPGAVEPQQVESASANGDLLDPAPASSGDADAPADHSRARPEPAGDQQTSVVARLLARTGPAEDASADDKPEGADESGRAAVQSGADIQVPAESFAARTAELGPVSADAVDAQEQAVTDDASATSPQFDSQRGLALAEVPETPVRPVTEAVPPPRGVVVVAVGDPVLADPMVREIEAALGGTGRPLIDRRFVRGLDQYASGNDIDLGGLAEAAMGAGARYAVVVRALPAGERELYYYNRVDTAYIAQLEAVTYDLHRREQIGSSPIEEVEFTSLNATDKAREAVQPWLVGLREQLQ